MKVISGLKVEYVKSDMDYNEQEERQRLIKFVTLISQVGFREYYIKPEEEKQLNYCK